MQNIKRSHIVIAIIVLVCLYIGSTYNNLIGKSNGRDTAWSQVENNFQSRFDLVPNLAAIANRAADFEKSTFTELAEARSAWQKAPSTNDKIMAGQEYQGVFSRLLLTFENYPQLTASKNYLTFQSQLEGVENRLRVARKDFNDATLKLNNSVQKFPSNIIANIFGFSKQPLFEAADQTEFAPELKNILND